MTGEFFEDTRLLGRCSPVKDYQFCWQLNNRLRFDFRINNGIEIQLTKRQRILFRRYEYRETAIPCSIFSIIISLTGEYLLPEFKHLDFSGC